MKKIKGETIIKSIDQPKIMREGAAIVKGTGWGISGEMATKMLSFIYVIILAQLFLQEYVGEFYLAISILGILEIFSDLGIISAMSRFLPYYFGQKQFKKIKTLIKFEFFGATLIALILYSLVFLFSGDIGKIYENESLGPIIQIMALYLIINNIFRVGRGILIARKNIRDSQTSWVAQNLSKLVLTLVFFAYLGADTESLALAYVGSFAVALVLSLFFAWRELKKLDMGKEKETLGNYKEIAREVIPFGLMTLLLGSFWTLVSYFDRIMIGYFLNVEQVAVYSIAIGLGTLLLMFQRAISNIFFPIVSELIGLNNKKEATKTIEITIKWLLMIIMPVALVVILFAKNFLALFFGNEYAGGAMVVVLFTLGLIIRSISMIPGLVLMALKRLDIEVKVAAFAVVINIVLNLFLIPEYGIDGAAFASAFAFLTVTVLLIYYSRKIFGFRFPKEAYKPLIAGVIAFGLLLLVKPIAWEIVSDFVSGIHIGASEGGLFEEILKKVVKLGVFGILFLVSCLVYFLGLLGLKSFKEDEIAVLDAGMNRVNVPSKYRNLIIGFLEAKWIR